MQSSQVSAEQMVKWAKDHAQSCTSEVTSKVGKLLYDKFFDTAMDRNFSKPVAATAGVVGGSAVGALTYMWLSKDGKKQQVPDEYPVFSGLVFPSSSKCMPYWADIGEPTYYDRAALFNGHDRFEGFRQSLQPNTKALALTAAVGVGCAIVAWMFSSAKKESDREVRDDLAYCPISLENSKEGRGIMNDCREQAITIVKKYLKVHPPADNYGRAIQNLSSNDLGCRLRAEQTQLLVEAIALREIHRCIPKRDISMRMLVCDAAEQFQKQEDDLVELHDDLLYPKSRKSVIGELRAHLQLMAYGIYC